MDSAEGGLITKFSVKIVNHNTTDIITLSAISLAVNLRSESIEAFTVWKGGRKDGRLFAIPATLSNIQRLFSEFVSPCRKPLLSNCKYV
jgi:hypothetical protein